MPITKTFIKTFVSSQENVGMTRKMSHKLVKMAKKGKLLPQSFYQSIIRKGYVITFLLNRNERGQLQAMVVNVSRLAG